MKKNVTKLSDVQAEDFDKTWKILSEIGTQERHFNSLQSNYRKLASSWLLAVFGGVGFVLSGRISTEPALLVSGIGLAGGVGIVLLWIMDLLVYQQLLHACFSAGQKLEQEYEWLPRIRTGMLATQGAKGIRPRMVWFYMIGAFTPFGISIVGLFYRLLDLSISIAIATASAEFLILSVTLSKLRNKSLERPLAN